LDKHEDKKVTTRRAHVIILYCMQRPYHIITEAVTLYSRVELKVESSTTR